MNLSYDYEICAPRNITVNPDDYLTVKSIDELIYVLDGEQSDSSVDAMVDEDDAEALWKEIQKRKSA